MNKGEEESKIANFIIDYIDIIKDNNFDFLNFFGNNSSDDCVNKNIGWYGHSFKLTLYYLINFEYIDEKNRFKIILDEIWNLGGDTDTNTCIVWGIIGLLIGFKNFGVYFDKVHNLIPHDRYLFPTFIMVFYEYLKNSNRNNKLIQNEKYFLKVILSLLYDDIEIEIDYE